MITLYADRTGFPLLHLPDLSLCISLLPITKMQFEVCLAEPNELGNRWYEELLSTQVQKRMNSRVSYRSFQMEQRERLFLTAILPQEALFFTKWLGEGFNLPSAQEWWSAYQLLKQESNFQKTAEQIVDGSFNPSARSILQRFLKELQPRNLAEFGLMWRGLLEWVRTGNPFKETFAYMGAPRQGFFQNTYNLSKCDPVHSDADQRLPYIGFRVIRRVRAMEAGGCLESAPVN